MKTIRGHFDDNIVILDEPPPVDDAAEVMVEFPEAPDAASLQSKRVFHWQQRLPNDTFEGSVADEVIRHGAGR